MGWTDLRIVGTPFLATHGPPLIRGGTVWGRGRREEGGGGEGGGWRRRGGGGGEGWTDLRVVGTPVLATHGPPLVRELGLETAPLHPTRSR